MAFQFHLPDIGEGVIEGEVVSWKVAEGDTIELDAPMVEIMTDKATVEIPSPRSGTISKINFAEGEICPVGDVLVEIEESGSVQASAPAAESRANGNGATAPAAVVAVVAAARPELIDASSGRAKVKATPATRRLARQLRVDLSFVRGTGRAGRVTTEDVRMFADGGGAATAASVPSVPDSSLRDRVVPDSSLPPRGRAGVGVPPVTHAPVPAVMRAPAPQAAPRSGAEQRVPFRGIRRRIAENMTRSKFTATHFTYVEEIDVTDLVEVRARSKARAAQRGIKLTYLPFIIKAIVAGLKKWPTLNASLDETTQEIVRKGYYHIGIAAQGPQGLVVTVVRDADKLSIFQIAAELERLAQAVQNGTATRADLTGSTFTISSLGKLGGVLATPIINFPEVGIVGVHKIEERPAVRDGEIVARWLTNMSISLDHRLVDGWDGAMFLQDVKALLEDPNLMFMEMV